MMQNTLRAGVAALALMALSAGSARAALRPEVGKPLQAAIAAMGHGNYAAAKNSLHSAMAAKNRTAEEDFDILQVSAGIARATKDYTTASHDYQELLASGRLGADETAKVLMAEAAMAYEQQNYPAVVNWAEKYQHAGGYSAEMHNLEIQAYYLQHDYASAAKLQWNSVSAELRAGRAPAENELEMLSSCYENLHNANAFQGTMKLLVEYYPKPDYWLNLVHAVVTKPTFADRMQLDIDRVKLHLGLMTNADDYFETILLALQEPLPGEAKTVLDQAYAKGIFGTGPQAARQQRLRDKITSTAAEVQKSLAADETAAAGEHSGDHLFALGEIEATNGNAAKGIEMMETAIRMDQLTRPEDSKLHLGIAYLRAGQTAKAKQMLNSVRGADGTQDIAQLWVLSIK